MFFILVNYTLRTNAFSMHTHLEAIFTNNVRFAQKEKIGCGTWIRTKILGFKGRCPTIRRSRNINTQKIRVQLLCLILPLKARYM